MNMTDIQFVMAQRLACAYAHEWGFVAIPPEVRDAEGIAAVVREQRTEYSMRGIEAPTVEEGDDGKPVVRHTTGTGRTMWTVYDDGRVVVLVYRPSGLVIKAWIAPDGSLKCWGWHAFFIRHVHALAGVLDATGYAPQETIDEALAPLFEQALPSYDGDIVGAGDIVYKDEIPTGPHYVRFRDEFKRSFFAVVAGGDRQWAPSEEAAARAVMALRERGGSAFDAVYQAL